MCFLSPSGGGSGDVTQNSYYNSRNRPWDPTDTKPMSPAGDFTTAGTEKLAVGASAPKQTPKRSSLTTGGSA
tara:strand:- start:507 stop:722 length:216 start_codon:yes stop_codon:yes gene_type:complete